MRVALLCPNYPPEFTGGTERVTRALAVALVTRADDVVVICGSDAGHDGTDIVRQEVDGVAVLRLPRRDDEGYGLELQRPRLRALTADLLREFAIDVVHLHHWSTLSIETLRMARDAGCGTVVTLHDMWTSCPRFFRQPPAGITCPEGDLRAACAPCSKVDLAPVPLWGLRLGIANRDREIQRELAAAAVITAPSRACAAAAATHVPWTATPIEVVPHGLLEPVVRRAVAPADGPLRIGTFGNLVRAKGVMLLAQATAGLAGVELHLHGPFLEPGVEDEVRAIAARGGVALECHGAYDVAHHPAASLDLAVFPSLCQETYGLVVEEALAHGVPVVVSDAGALPERVVAGAGGVVVPMGDGAALRAALAPLAEDREQYRRLRSAIPDRFPSISDAAARYADLYRKAMETTR